MTDQELADTIRKRFPDVDAWIMPVDLIQFLQAHPPVVPEPPCTIDQVPGWTVHTDALGRRFAYNAGLDQSSFLPEQFHKKGVYSLKTKRLHPWPDPPLYQPGDLVDVLDPDDSDDWSHLGRYVLGVLAHSGSVVTEDRHARLNLHPSRAVRPHVEGTE